MTGTGDGPASHLRQPVLAVIAIAVLAALLGAGVMSHAPNRLVSGRPLGLVEGFGNWGAALAVGLTLAMLAKAFLPQDPAASLRTAVLAGVALLLLLFAAGEGARRLAEGAAPAARTSLGSGFWIAAIGFGLIARDALARARAPLWLRLAALVAVLAGFGLMAQAGALDQLSLMREYFSRRDAFLTEAARHVVIAVSGLVPAIALGAALGLVLHARPRAAGATFTALDTVQVIPAIALFALMMAPLAALAQRLPVLRDAGVGGIGPAPAIVAIILYLLLPIVRTVHAGLASVDPAVVEAARGMGFSRRRLLVGIEVPLALPVVLAGVRVAAVQSIGLATLAALVGGGGLGTFVFQGMSQFALDLVLLGVVPIAALTALADMALRTLETAAAPEGGR